MTIQIVFLHQMPSPNNHLCTVVIDTLQMGGNFQLVDQAERWTPEPRILFQDENNVKLELSECPN